MSPPSTDNLQPDLGPVVANDWRQTAWLAGLMILLTVLAYLPAFSAGFNWDDDAHVTRNPCVVGPLGLKEIWTTRAARICPLVQTTFWVEHRLWGLAPLPYHAVNILVHGACAVVLWRVLRRLQVRGAWFGAALWALHPVQVESVAWITELKNTQSGLFFLLAILFYTRFKEKPTRRYYALALVFGALAMASKSSTVVLPVVLGLCGWWIGRQWRWRDAIKLAPFFVMSLMAAGVSVWTQKLEGATGSEYVRSLGERVAVAGKVVWFYAGKLIWPHPLTFIYPRWEVDAANIMTYLPVLAVVVVLVVLWWQRERWWGRPGLFAFGYFVVALGPVLGLIDHYFLRYSFVGDHFQYLAGMGLVPLAAAGWGRYPYSRVMRPVLAGVLLVFAGLTWQQAKIYQDPETLWSDTVAKNPAAGMAHNNLGLLLAAQGKVNEAIAHYEQALQIKPDSAEALINLADALATQGKVSEAVQQYERALQVNPDYAQARNNLGIALVRLGKLPEAIQQYERALLLCPDSDLAHNNLGNALIAQGRLAEGIQQCERALQLNPDSAEAHNNLGNALTTQGRLPEAVQHCQRALQLKPGYAEAHYNLGNALAAQGMGKEAVQQYERALQLKPDHARARNNMGIVLAGQGKLEEAIAQYERALQLKPDYVEAHVNLADALTRVGRLAEAIQHCERALLVSPHLVEAHINLGDALAAQGKATEAIQQYERVLQLKPDSAEAHLNMGDVLTRQGKSKDALSHFQQALQLATARKNTALAEAIRSRLQSFPP